MIMTSEKTVLPRSKSRSALENKNKRRSLHKSSTSTVLKETNSQLSIFEEKQNVTNSPYPIIKEPCLPKRTLSKCKAKIDLKSVAPVEPVLSTSRPPGQSEDVECRKSSVEIKSISKLLSKSRTSARLSSIAEMNAINQQLSKVQPVKSLSKSKTSVKLENPRVLSHCKTSTKLPLQISKIVCDKPNTTYTDQIVKKTEEKISKASASESNNVPEKTMTKQKTVTKMKPEAVPRSFRKTRSQSLIPEEILLSKFVNIDISDKPKDEKKTNTNSNNLEEEKKQENIETPTAVAKVGHYSH